MFKNRIAKGTPDNAQARKRRFSLKRISTSILWLSTAAAFASALAVTQIGSGLQLTTVSFNTAVVVTQGSVLQGLHWGIVALLVLFALRISIISDQAVLSTAGPSTAMEPLSSGSGSGGFADGGL